MPFNGSGIWSWPYNWVNDAANGIPITASRMDAQFNDAGNNGFDNVLTRDGQGIATANLPMGGFKHTGVAAGTALTDYADVGSVQAAKYNWIASAGTVDAITAAYAPAIAALTDGMLCYFRATGANATTTPTFAPSGLTAHTITKQGGSALLAGDIPANLAECIVRYNLANTRWELLNPAKVSASIGLVGFQNYLTGLTLSTAGSSATFGIAVGQAADTTNVALMTLASAYTKTTSAWAVGTGNGALDTGAIATSTWYHVYLIQRSDTGVVDVLISTSASAPTLPTSYDRKRRIGSMKTNGSSQWTSFIQVGDWFAWAVSVLDVTGGPTTGSTVTVSITVPLGVSVTAQLSGIVSSSGGAGEALWLSSPLQANQAATSSGPLTAYTPTTTAVGYWAQVMTDTSRQINYYVTSGIGLLRISTQGWFDTRGK